MLKRIYYYSTLWLEKRPWGVHLIYHSIRHYKVYEFMEALFVAFFFAMIIRAFFFQAFKIPSESMVPTLQIGDRLFVNKMIYHFYPPEIGDIVVFKTPPAIYEPRKPIYVKRLVGLGGDEVCIQPNGQLYVNGKLVAHPVILSINYTRRVTDLTGRPKMYDCETVKENEVYLFGDNSGKSYDSRYWGGVPRENIKGKAVLRWWPPGRFGLLE